MHGEKAKAILRLWSVYRHFVMAPIKSSDIDTSCYGYVPPTLAFCTRGVGTAADSNLYIYRPTKRDSKLAATIMSTDVAFSFIQE